jgi:RNA polymerase sigma factor (sigma-70 family)
LPEPNLTREQEAALAKQGTEEAHVELVMGNIRQGFAYARTYSGTRFEDGELLSIVYKAMMAAARRFQHGRQTLIRFSKPFIRGELHRAWRSSRPLGTSLDAAPEPATIKTMTNDENSHDESVAADFVDFDFAKLDEAYDEARIQRVLCRLSKHERLVIDLVFFGGLSLSDAARLTRTKRQAVHQVVENALEKFRRFIR